MDIYRFFHPHHNPRLFSTPLRQHELCELLQAASELRKAIDRAQQRSERAPSPPILPQHFTDSLKALRFVEHSLETLIDAHPGEAVQELTNLIAERANFPGWEQWLTLVTEQLVNEPESTPVEEQDTMTLRKVG